MAKNAVRYYADLADNYAPSRVRQLHQSKQWLQIICFIHHRYQQMMDNLITSFIYHTRSIIADGKEYADNAAMEYGAKMVVEMPKLAQFLMWYPHRDKTLTPEEQDKQAYNILPVAQFPVLAQFLGGKSFDKKTALWEFYAKSSRTFALYLRPIMLAVPLIFYKEEHKIVRLMELIKNHYGRGKAPAAFKLPDDIKATIPEKMLTYLKRNPDDESVDPHLFEFYVYRKMYQHLDKGRLCCNDSISYCDIDHDLIEDHLVDDIEKIATEFGYPLMALFCDEHLDESLDSLDKAWDTTTERIKLGQNTGFKTKETQTGEQDWSLRYDSKEELDDAFGISMQKMSDMSDLSYSLLRSTQEDFIRVGTLCAANDIASNLIHALLIFNG